MIEELEAQARLLGKFLPRITDDELAMAHMICPKLYAMYTEMRTEVTRLSDQVMYLEEKRAKYMDDYAHRTKLGRPYYE